MPTLKFHGEVKTPDGIGLVQGWYSERQEDGSYKRTGVLVSFHKDQNVSQEYRLGRNGSVRGVWSLAKYPYELLEAI